MVGPFLCAWIEERSEFTTYGINRGNVRPFETIAIEASQGQVVGSAFAAVLRRDDVIRFMREESLFFWQETVFAAPLGPFSHLSSQRWRDTSGAHRWLSM
jgi:hypothetical protein